MVDKLSLRVRLIQTTSSAIVQIANSQIARAYRDGMLWLVPYLMIWVLLRFTAEVATWLPAIAGSAFFFNDIAGRLREAMPLVFWGAIGTVLALQKQLPRTAVAFICVSIGIVLQYQVLVHFGENSRALFTSMAFIGPVLTVSALIAFGRFGWTQLVAQTTSAGQNVRDSLNLVFPSILTLVSLSAALWLIASICQASSISWSAAWLLGLPSEVLALIYTLLNSVLWFFGIHGYYALLPLHDALQQSAVGSLSQGFLGIYVFIGGCGATLSLIVAILIASRSPRYRTIAAVSLIPASINVNELLLFGLPIILNVRFVIPFIIAPLANFCISVGAVELGWIGWPTSDLPFNSPVILNAFLATEYPFRSSLLQLINVAVGAMIYLPFVRQSEKSLELHLNRDFGLKALDTNLSQSVEEADFTLDDPIRSFVKKQTDQEELDRQLKVINEHEFDLYYQPKINPHTGAVIGAEALIRMRNVNGEILTPGSFLPHLEGAGLMKSVDAWVLRKVIDQLDQWEQESMPLVPIAVNISPESLVDQKAIVHLTELAVRQRGKVDFEITERAIVGEENTVQWSLEKLKATGAKLQIDDFGTGYSSLSYLHRYAIDGIKIDRSFTAALTFPRGRAVFHELCLLASQLNLSVVVEGLEEAWQLEHLPTNVDLCVQGWYYSGALTKDQFSAFVKARVEQQTPSAIDNSDMNGHKT